MKRATTHRSKLNRSSTLPQSIDLQVERLECRQMLAGHVLAIVTTAGDLIIEGDNAPNDININIAANGQVAIEGLTGTAVHPINLDVSRLSGNILIDMGGGNDLVTLYGPTNANAPVRSMHVRLGAGDDVFTADNIAGASGSMEIVGGSGADAIAVKYSSFRGKATISTGGGNDVVGLQEFNASNIEIKTASGDDEVELVDTGSDNNLAISTSSGNDEVVLDGAYAYAALSVRTAGGNDSISLENCYAKYATINSGGGHDTLDIGALTAGDSMKLIAGGGNDRVEIRSSEAANSQVVTGGGSDEVTLLESDLGSLSANLGGGADRLVSDVGVVASGTASGGGGVDELDVRDDANLDVEFRSFES
ncbi:MAG: hypothetical protein KDA60_11940 [Planctomycetales bacterium]|nr:hypothetical protein [Planctomycetales bacterium]